MRRFSVVFVSFCIVAICYAQTVTNVQSHQYGQNVIVTYNLDKPANNVSLQVSMDNGKTFSGDLKHVSGNVGKNVAAGENRIVWNVLAELESLVGEQIRFRVVTKKDVKFSVAPGKYVRFSPGNLMFNPTLGSHKCADGTTQPGTWRFAEHQYDYIGDANSNISSIYSGWIDLFGWGTSGYKGKYPYMTSTDYSDYGHGKRNIAGTHYDWGVYNAISNGGDEPGLWRTLTQAEWYYLFNTRSNAGQKFSRATVNGEAGLIILPDNWSLPSGISFTAQGSGYTTNTYSLAQWTTMEAAGAVFLPAAGYRDGTSMYIVGTYGSYWSSTYSSSNNAYYVYFNSGYLNPSSYNSRYDGRSVRLCSEIK